MDESTLKRFWSKVNKQGPVPAHVPHLGPCWVWLGPCGVSRYARFNTAHGRRYAHHVAWESENGPLPDGMRVLHACDNGPIGCVRPGHLFVGTQADNMRDMATKGRSRNGVMPGTKNGNAKLSESDVQQIRALSGSRTVSSVAKEYGVSRRMVNRIQRRENWKHI